MPDYEEEVLKAMAKRGQQAISASSPSRPRPSTRRLETFGRKDESGKPQPFHLYTMRQAIEEGFILDVLKNYTTYKTYFRLIKAVEDDPKLDKKKAARALARFVSCIRTTSRRRREVMVEHFRTVTRHKIGGQAKAMVVTGSRAHAVRYKQEFDKYIAEKGYTEIKTLVAFSGTVRARRGRRVHRGRDEHAASGRKNCRSGSRRTSSRSCSSPRSTRPASTSRCCTRCTWISGWRTCRPCRRCRG